MFEEKPENPTDNHIGAQRQRRHGNVQDAIADLIRDIPRGTHLTAPEVYRRAKETGLQVSLSTVYRTLHLLQEHGNVTTLGGDRGLRYEAAGSGDDHDHLICLKCGLTIEFFDDLIRGFGASVAQRKGYEHRASRFDILGICAECKATDEDHRIEQYIDSLTETITAADEAIALCRRAITFCQSRRIGKSTETVQTAVDRLSDATAAADEALILLAGDAVRTAGNES